jgi:hypothetical protein
MINERQQQRTEQERKEEEEEGQATMEMSERHKATSVDANTSPFRPKRPFRAPAHPMGKPIKQSCRE